MKRSYLKDNDMKKRQVIHRPISLADLTFDDLYEDISDHWELKARRLQSRRWRKIKDLVA